MNRNNNKKKGLYSEFQSWVLSNPKRFVIRRVYTKWIKHNLEYRFFFLFHHLNQLNYDICMNLMKVAVHSLSKQADLIGCEKQFHAVSNINLEYSEAGQFIYLNMAVDEPSCGLKCLVTLNSFSRVTVCCTLTTTYNWQSKEAFVIQ